MPVSITYPAASADDGIWINAVFISNGSTANVGYNGGYYHSFIRFTNVVLAKEAVVSTALLNLISGGTNTGGNPISIRIYANDIDDAANPTSAAECNALALTTAYVDWTWPSSAAGTINTSPDIKTVLQEVLNRSGWASGNDIIIVIKSTSTDVLTGGYRTYDYGSNFPELNVLVSDNPSYNDILFPLFGVVGTAFSTQSNTMPLPSFVVEATGTLGLGAVCTFPSMSLDAHAEVAPTGSLDVSLPSLSLSASVGLHGELEVDLPFWSVTSKTGEGTSFTLPEVTLVATAYHAYSGNMSASLPVFTSTGTGLVGEIGDGSITLSKLTSTGTAYDIPVGTFSSELPGFTAYATGYSSDRFANYVLRYTR